MRFDECFQVMFFFVMLMLGEVAIGNSMENYEMVRVICYQLQEKYEKFGYMVDAPLDHVFVEVNSNMILCFLIQFTEKTILILLL